MSILKLATAALLATTAVVTVASTAQAQDFKGVKGGDFVVRARGLAVLPQEEGNVNSSALGTIGTVNVGNAYIPELDFTYFVTPNIGVNLIAGTSRHHVTADTIVGRVDVGKVSLLPPVLTATYHPLPNSRVNPYVGAGINYTLFYREDAAGGIINSTNYKNRFGWALQAGTDIYVTDNILLNLDVKKVFLKTDVSIGSVVGPLSSKVTLNPWLVGVGVGYKF
ncbi:OmpW/AlkL family protein [Azospirillum sp. sgz301742]